MSFSVCGSVSEDGGKQSLSIKNVIDPSVL